MSLYADEPDLMGPPAIYAVCSECSTQKPRGEIRGGVCDDCRRIEMKRPSTEQLEQIRRLSEAMYSNAGLAFKRHGMPESRDEAGALLRKLHAIRDNEEPDEEGPMEETRECAECGAEKSIDEFRKFGRGRMKKCLDCDRFENDPEGDRAEKAETSPKVERRTVTLAEYDPTLPVYDDAGNVIKEPVERVTEGHWCLSELRDPRLSVVRQAQKILDAKGLIDVSIEDTAEILAQIADLDLA